MKINRPIERPELTGRLQKTYDSLLKFVDALNEKELTESFVNTSNEQIAELDQLASDDRVFKKKLVKIRSSLSSRAIKELKYIPKNYYMVLGMAIGMSAFGIPMGVVFGTVMDNMGLLSLGIPIGMSMGMVFGIALDKKAQDEGRQLSATQ